MKARRRVVSSSASSRRAPLPRPKRTPTVRRIKSAIVPIEVVRPRTQSVVAIQAPKAPPPPAGAAPPAEIDLSVDLGRGLVLRNPLIAASGPYGYGVEEANLVALDRLGAIVTRTTTLRPRTGGSSVRPRIVEVAGGIVSGVGLPNPGIEAVLERYATTWARWDVPVILSIGGDALGDVVALVNLLEGDSGIAGLELNLSSADRAGSFVSAVRRATDLPLIAKLPWIDDSRAVARAVADAGADAIAAINAVPGLAVGSDRSAPAFDAGAGLLSGPAIRPIGLRVVSEVVQAVSIPVIGIGGVSRLDDVLDYLAVGASAVGVATAALAEPDLPVRLGAALLAHCQTEGTSSLASLVGTARSRRRKRGS